VFFNEAGTHVYFFENQKIESYEISTIGYKVGEEYITPLPDGDVLYFN